MKANRSSARLSSSRKSAGIFSELRRSPKPAPLAAHGTPVYQYRLPDFSILPIQPKLKVGAANDPLEREADQTADRVMRAQPADIRRKCGPCAAEEREGKIARMENEEDEEIHRMEEEPEDETMFAKRESGAFSSNADGFSSNADGSFEVDGHVRGDIDSMRASGGSPLPESERAFLEPRFGRDLSSIRIHTDARARSTASAINAKAYTLGNHIAFNRGEFRPGTADGRRLLAHEITHTIQQGSSNEQALDGRIHRLEEDERPDLPEIDIEWEPDSDNQNFFIVRDGERILVLPASQFLYRPARGDKAKPWLGLPAVSKEGRRLFRTGGGAGVLMDVGGLPGALLPESMAALRARMGVAKIDAIMIIHVHADHVRHLENDILRNRIPAKNVLISDAWLKGESGPLAEAVRNLRNTNDPRLLELGFGPGWKPERSRVSQLPDSGVFRIPVKIGDLRFEMIGRGEAFRDYSERHRQGKAAGTLADTASFLVIASQGKAQFDIAVLGDLRGADILELRGAMEREKPGSFAAAFSRVGTLSGFQHHMGVTRNRADVQGLIHLLSVTQFRTRALTVVVQSRVGGDFLNRELMTALGKLGVRVLVVTEPKQGDPSNARVDSSGRAVTQGPSVLGAKVEPAVNQARERVHALTAIREYAKGGNKIPELNMSPEQMRKAATREIARLRKLMNTRARILLEPLVNEAARKNSASIGANTRALFKQGAFEGRIVDFIESRIANMRKTGAVSPGLLRISGILHPGLLASIRVDEKGRPVWTRNQRSAAVMRRWMDRKLSRIMRTGPPTLSAGGKGVASLLVLIDIVNQAGSVHQQMRRNNSGRFRNNILQFYNIWSWWAERGAYPPLRGARVPFIGENEILESKSDGGREIHNRVAKLVHGELPAANRVDEDQLPEQVREAKDIDFLWIEDIPDNILDAFNLWAHSHLRNIDDYFRIVIESKQKAITGKDGSSDGFVNWNWFVTVGRFEKGGIKREEKYSKRLTIIMRAAAKRIIEGTEAGLKRVWENRKEPPERTGAVITAPGGSRKSGPIEEKIGLESQRPTGRARMRTGRSGAVYNARFQGSGPPRVLVEAGKWHSNPEFYVFDGPAHGDGDSEFVLVGGSDHNTYTWIRRAEEWYVLRRVYISNRWVRPGRSKEEDDAMMDAQMKRGNAIYVKFDRPRAIGMRQIEGEVLYTRTGPNTSALALARRSDLIMEK